MSRNPSINSPINRDKSRELADKVLAILVPEMHKCLPEIEACDPWELTSSVMRDGVTQWTLLLACTERSKNGHSNHACARIWVTPSLKVKVDFKVKVGWTNGQDHFYPVTAGKVKSFSAMDHPVVLGRNIVSHIMESFLVAKRSPQ